MFHQTRWKSQDDDEKCLPNDLGDLGEESHVLDIEEEPTSDRSELVC